MNYDNIEDPMAEIMKKMIRLPKGKTKKDSVDLQEKDKLPNVIVLSKEAKEYLDTKPIWVLPLTEIVTVVLQLTKTEIPQVMKSR
mgnify:CR=1 FL=1